MRDANAPYISLTLEGDPDQPLISGCLYHKTNQVPYPLPAHKTRTVFKTLSTPGGKGYNELRIEDKKGAEQIFLHAQRDWDEHIERDQKIRVGNERHDTGEASVFSEFKAQEHRITHLDRKTEVRADDHLTVGETQQVKVGTAQLIEVGTEIHYYAGEKVVIEAGLEFTAKAGGSFVRVDAGGVTIRGPQVRINSGGAPGTGTGIGIRGPLLPGLADKDRFAKLPENAPRSHKARYVLQSEKTGEPLVGMPYTLKRADGTRIAGFTDEEGKTFQAHSTDPEPVELLTPARKLEPEESLIRAGERAPQEITLDFKNTEPEG